MHVETQLFLFSFGYCFTPTVLKHIIGAGHIILTPVNGLLVTHWAKNMVRSLINPILEPLNELLVTGQIIQSGHRPIQNLNPQPFSH
jgi:hypothetical protein